MKIQRYAFLLLPVFLFGIFGATAAARSEAPQGPAASGAVEVHLSEYAIAMPQTLPAGPTTFRVHNDGKKNHSFKIEGPGIDELLSTPLSPSETGEMKVTLQPGEYKVYCPVSSHQTRGMALKLVVTAK